MSTICIRIHFCPFVGQNIPITKVQKSESCRRHRHTHAYMADLDGDFDRYARIILLKAQLAAAAMSGFRGEYPPIANRGPLRVLLFPDRSFESSFRQEKALVDAE